MAKWIVLVGLTLLIIGINSTEVFGLGALDRILVSSERLVNAFGDQVSGQINIGQQVQVATDIANGQNESQPFVYILQIKNEQGHIISVSTIAGELGPIQSFSAALSWNPNEAGTYTAEIYVWESLVNADALAKPKILQMTVS